MLSSVLNEVQCTRPIHSHVHYMDCVYVECRLRSVRFVDVAGCVEGVSIQASFRSLYGIVT